KIARLRYRVDYDGRLRLSFDGKKSVYFLQLLSSPDEIATVPLYNRIHTGFDAAGLPTYTEAVPYNSSASRDIGPDPMVEREHGRVPWTCTLAVGALLDRSADGFTLANTVSIDGEIVPAVGLVVEDPKAFWMPLFEVSKSFESILRVKRSGPWDNR